MKKCRRWLWIVALLLAPACGLLVEEGRAVVAEVDGEPIRLNDLMKEIRKLPFEARAKTNDSDETVRQYARALVLRKIVNQEVFLKEAESRGIEITEEEIDAALRREEIPEQVHSNSSAAEETSHEHTHEADRHRRQEIQKMRDELIVEKLKAQEVSDDTVREYYEQHLQEKYIAPNPLVRYEIIEADTAHKKILDNIYEKAVQEGITLNDALASTADVPPDIVLVSTPQLALTYVDPEIRKQTKDLKPGDITPPFYKRAANGTDHYVTVRVVEYNEEIPIENVADQIRRTLSENFVEELYGKYNVTLYAEKLDYKVD
jgi:hypothetical protein